MLLVKSITPKKINGLQLKPTALNVLFIAFLTACSCSVSMAQDNSPYSRYGIGDLVPSTNINSRGMAGISAGYTDFYSINFSNPASYAAFQGFKEPKSNKLISGRAILDVGLNFENRTLSDPNHPLKFKTSNALFSHVQVGVPLRKNWGLSFGIRPVSRISYKIGSGERLFDPNTNQPIDSAYTEYNGDGGSYLPNVGTGFKLFSKQKGGLEKSYLAVGLNAGYLFGKKDYSTRRSLINDTVEYYRGNFENRTTYGNLFFNVGLQYRVVLDSVTTLTLGVAGNWQQKLKAKQDIIRETYYFDNNLGNTQLDSVSIQSNLKGDIQYPSSYTAGFVYERYQHKKKAGWLIGVDFTQTKWDNYRFYGQKDALKNKWELRVGGHLIPVPTKSYFSKIAYRAGFFTGPDYVYANNQALRQFGGSFGLGLPLANYNRQAINQATYINLSFEYINRGNSNNLLKDNLFRFSLGFSLSDIWFMKRKYD